MSIIELRNVSKSYAVGERTVNAIEDVSLDLEKGNLIVILGPSGAGKSTLLNLIGGLDSPTSGTITVGGTDISVLKGNALSDYRASKVGFVFQFYNLIPTLTIRENVALVNDIVDDPLDAEEMLRLVGLEGHGTKFPSQLSGGEQQRASIARALAKNPDVILCDEPTGALDSNTGVTILKLLHDMSKERGKTVIIVTHNQNIAKIADVIITVKNGRIQSCERQDSPSAIDEVDW
jgi:putative ABC transport system ATP-binding protein